MRESSDSQSWLSYPSAVPLTTRRERTFDGWPSPLPSPGVPRLTERSMPGPGTIREAICLTVPTLNPR